MSALLLKKINNPDAKTLKVLVAPLDWGLGHATRCIPIIKEFINQGCTVIIAAGGAQRAVIQEEFPDLSFVEIPGFRIKYGKNRAFTLAKIIFQIPKFLIGIKRENQWLRGFAGKEELDMVISDNRYGLSIPGLFTVFITHQLAPRSSIGLLPDRILQRINYRYIQRFSVCWVPDLPGKDNLAGQLSHPDTMPAIATRYIGLLSRLDPEVQHDEKILDLLFLLSGPEPQRSILEQLILSQRDRKMGRMALVRGLPKNAAPIDAPAGVNVYDYLPAAELGRLINQSTLVLARSGYSTVMDLVRMGMKAIYVPTPGQPEQEYLGSYLEQKGLGICIRQCDLILETAIAKAMRQKPGTPIDQDGILAAEIASIISIARSQSPEPDLG